MLDHLFLAVGNLDRAIAFHERVLPVLGIADLDGQPRRRLQELAARELTP